MKIIKLTAENVKRLKAVEITPDETVQVITGRNAQGKSSVLDAIWLALGGGAAARETSRPVRDGEDHGNVHIDLGELKVLRAWKNGKTTLTVTAADGAKYSSPQKVLDALVGRLSFDPLEFTRLSAKEQLAALLDLVDLDEDLDTIAAERARLFEARTEIGRQEKAIGDVSVDDALPEVETSASDLIEQIQTAEDQLRAQERDLARVTDLEVKVAALEEQLKAAATALDHARFEVEMHAPVPATGELRDRLASVEESNAAIRANNAARERAARAASLRAEYEQHTKQIGMLDDAKARALSRAEFPVAGLGFDDSGVTYQGVPFSQASSAEQIRVSLAMAMSLNPELRVIRILDGSLLDADNLALIQEMAADRDYQVWIERVSDGSGVGVVIEDGEVVS